MSTEPIDPLSSARAFYAVQLRRLRTEAKMTQSDVGGHPAVMVSGKLIGAVENCYRPPTLRLSQGLDKAFGLVQFFEGMYANIKRESGAPADYWEYAEYEGLASAIKIYQHFLVTGLLQTADYAREVLRAGQRPDRLDRLVSQRLDRQEILRQEGPPWLTVLMDEVVIRRVVGDPEIMQRQLTHIRAASQEPNVTIRIVPAGAPVHPSGGFTLLGFPDGPDIGYAESVGPHGRIIEPGSQVRDLAVLFDQIGAVTLTVADSEKLIEAVMEDL